MFSLKQFKQRNSCGLGSYKSVDLIVYSASKGGVHVNAVMPNEMLAAKMLQKANKPETTNQSSL